MLSRAGLTVALRVSVGGAIAACLGVKLGQGLELLGSCVWTRLQRWRSLCELRRATSVELAEALRIRDDMVRDARGSLNGDTACTLPMIPAYVEHLPTGSERGDYFALDLGGTNFRVRHVSMGGRHGSLQSSSSEAALSSDILKAPVESLFDFMAESSIPFMKQVVDVSTSVPRIGFTFSFPMEQTGIAKGRLLRWTKNYTCPGGVGSDPVKLLKEAFARKGVQVEVPVLANDTVALLAAGRYHHQDCRLAVILGTGTNAAYMERLSAIAKLRPLGPGGPHRQDTGSGEPMMAINTEWSDFRAPSLPLLPEDVALDAASNKPGFQIYEKLISGMYLGEIVRRILLRLTKQGLLWGGEVPFPLRVERGFPTWAVSRMDDNNRILEARAVLAELQLDPEGKLSKGQVSAIVEVCHRVGRRAARLAGAGGATIPCTIAVDGGLYENYSAFRQHVKDLLTDALGKEGAARLKLVQARDGSGDGAALLAACAAS